MHVRVMQDAGATTSGVVCSHCKQPCKVAAVRVLLLRQFLQKLVTLLKGIAEVYAN